MKIPDFHVSNVSVDETFFVDNLDLLEIIISSLVSQYIDQEIRAEDLVEKFTVPVVDTNASAEVQKEQIKAQLPDEQKALPVETQNLIAEVLQSSPPAKVEIKPAVDPVTGEVDESKPKTIEVSAKEELNSDGTPVINLVTQKPVGYDTVVSTFSQEAEDTATKVTFEIEQSAVIEEGSDEVIIAAGLYLPRPPSANRKKTIVQRSVESTVRKVVSRMSKNNEGVYPAIASVMESSYNIEATNLGKMLNTFYVFFVDVTKESDGLKWSFVYPVQGQNNSVAYNYEPLDVPDNISANVGVTINADYLRKPNVFDITFGDVGSGTSFKTSVDLNPPPPPEPTPENPNPQPQPVATIIPFDEPGTPFVVINGGDKVNIKDIEKVFDPPDPTPTPSPTITITHPTPTPSISITPSTTIYPTPTPTMTITPTITTTGTQDITTLFKFDQNGANVDVSLNTNQMNIEGTTEDIAGFTLAFFVPSSVSATTGDNKVSLIDSFDDFEYRYATSNNTSNILYITGYCTFIGSQEVPIDRVTNDGYMKILRINGMNVNNVSPVNPSFNNVVAISNKEAKLWDLNMVYNASIRSGFYVSDMTDEYIMLHVDGSMFEEDASSFKLNLEGIVIESVEDASEFNGWDVTVNGEKDGITATKKEGYAKMRKGDMRRIKLRYREIKGDIKIKEAYANEKKIESGYLIPEDVQFDNGIARIRTKHLKDSLLKSFLVMTKGDLGTVTASQLMTDAGWAIESKYSTRDGYTRIMGYSTTSTPRKFEDMDALFRYTHVIRTQRIASQFPGYAFVNALNTNIAIMANVLTSEDTIDGMSRFTWLLDHIADKSKIPASESLKEFFVKSDVTFDGRILVNDVVALKQYILGGLTYPEERPLGVFEVKYTVSGVNDVIFGNLSNNLQAISAAIESKIYERTVNVNDVKNVSIIGTERTLSGDMNIYARVFWRDAVLYNNAITNSNNMFESVQYTSYSIVPERARPEGVVAVGHNGGTSFTVYGYGLSEISYSTYYTSASKTISNLSTSAYSHDITIPDGELQSVFDVLYVSGSGGRTVATAVSDIPTPSISVTPTISATPSATSTVTVTPTITKTEDAPVPTPTMTYTDTGSPPKEDPVDGFDPNDPFAEFEFYNPAGPKNFTNKLFVYIDNNFVALDKDNDKIGFLVDEGSGFKLRGNSGNSTGVFTPILDFGDGIINGGWRIADGFAGNIKIKYVIYIKSENALYMSPEETVTLPGTDGKLVDWEDTSFQFTKYKDAANDQNQIYETPTASISVTPTPTVTTTFSPTPTITYTDTGSPPKEDPVDEFDPNDPFAEFEFYNPAGPKNFTNKLFVYIDNNFVALDKDNDKIGFLVDEGSGFKLRGNSGNSTGVFTPILDFGDGIINGGWRIADGFAGNIKIKYVIYIKSENALYMSPEETVTLPGTDGKLVDWEDTSFQFTKYKDAISTSGRVLVKRIDPNLMLNKLTTSVDGFTITSEDFQWVSFYQDATISTLSTITFDTLLHNDESRTNKMKVINELGIEVSWGKNRRSGQWMWSNEGYGIVYNGRYVLRNADTFSFTNNNKSTETLVNFPNIFTWVGGPPKDIKISEILLKNVTQSPETYKSLSIVDDVGITTSWGQNRRTQEWGWSDPNKLMEAYKGYYIRAPDDYLAEREFSWPAAQPTEIDSSGKSTFDVTGISTSGNWTQFNIEIDTSTLNPYEFYTNNDDSGEWPASVTRKGDKGKSNSELVLSKIDKRYERIRSIELVMKDHVYFNSNVNNDSIVDITDKSDNNLLLPDHDKMYVYCSRTSIDSYNETRVMVVNAHNHLRHSVLSLNPKVKLSQALFINTPNLSKTDIMNRIDWNKTYIGTTSIYKGEYDAGTESEPSYELTKYPDNVGGISYTRGNTIRDYFWKLKDGTPESEGFNRGLFLRYSLDDGQKIIRGGVSDESLTSHGSTSRLIIDDMFVFGNIDGNVEE